jgi:hypothetical protein
MLLKKELKSYTAFVVFVFFLSKCLDLAQNLYDKISHNVPSPEKSYKVTPDITMTR